MSWIVASFLLAIIVFVASQLAGAPSRILDHVTYLSGTLGTGKTSYVALVAAELRRREIPYLATFALKGAIPFDLDLDEWPEEEGIVIFLDELLLLEANDFIDWGKFSDGLALARQKGQQVVILSQAHRPGWGKVTGTIGTYCIIRGFSFGKLGRLVQIRRSSEPFTRINGYKAPGIVRTWHWIPGSIFATYNSKLIYGYTCDKELNKFSRDDMAERRFERVERRTAAKRRLPGSRRGAARPASERSEAGESGQTRGLHRYDW